MEHMNNYTVIEGIIKGLSDYADRVMNVKQVAEYLGLSAAAVRKRCHRNQLPYHYSAGRLYFSKKEIDDTLLNRKAHGE